MMWIPNAPSVDAEQQVDDVVDEQERSCSISVKPDLVTSIENGLCVLSVVPKV